MWCATNRRSFCVALAKEDGGFHGEVAPNHEEVVKGAKANEWCNRCSFITPPLFLRCWSGERRRGTASGTSTSTPSGVRRQNFFNIAILHRSLFFVNRAFMTLFDNLNIHFVVLGAGALQRKHIFLCSILERTKGGKKAYLILPPPPLQPFNASRGEITGFPCAAVNRPSLVEKRCPSLAYFLSLCILPFRAIHFFLLSLGGEF